MTFNHNNISMKKPIPEWLMKSSSPRQLVEDILNSGVYRYTPSENKQQYIHIEMGCHILYKPQRQCLNVITYIPDALFLTMLMVFDQLSLCKLLLCTNYGSLHEIYPICAIHF